MQADGFSVRYAATINVAGGLTDIETVADDGIRVWIDGSQIVNSWTNQQLKSYANQSNLTAGSHLFVVEYFDQDDWSTIRIGLRPVATAGFPTPGGAPTGNVEIHSQPAFGSSPIINHGVSYVQSMSAAANGEYLLVDSVLPRVVRVKADGTVETVAGTGIAGFTGDNGPAASARLNAPSAAVETPNGDVYIADNGNRRIRRVARLTGIISTVVGTGVDGFSGDPGSPLTSHIGSVLDLALDNASNVYFLDAGNGRVRVFDITNDEVRTVLGTNSGSTNFDGDTNFQLVDPRAIAVRGGPSGTLVVTDNGAGVVVLEVDLLNSRVKILAGGGTKTTNAIFGTSAALQSVRGVAYENSGDVVFVDSGYKQVLRVRTSGPDQGTIGVVAGGSIVGTGNSSGSAVGAATDVFLRGPYDVEPFGSDMYINARDGFTVLKLVP